MSSKFLDKTGLETFWAKIKSRFAESTKVVAIADATVSRYNYGGGSSWYKVAECNLKRTGHNANASFDVYFSRGSWRSYGQLHVCVRNRNPFVIVLNKVYTESIEPNFGFKLVTRGTNSTPTAVAEIWAYCNENEGGVALIERNGVDGAYAADSKSIWAYTSYGINDAGSEAPVADTEAKVAVSDTDVIVRLSSDGGNGSNVTSTFTKASGDTSSIASGGKLSAIFTAISSFFSTVASHIANSSNPHNVTKTQIGLGNVDNTSDLDKPVSTATQTALNAKASDSVVVHLTGTETIQGNKIFNNLWPLLASESTTVSTHKVPVFLDRGSLYADWTQEQKDGNHYRRWRIAINPLYATYYVIKVSLIPGYSNSSGVGLLEKVVVARPRTPTGYAEVYDAYTAAVGAAATEFRIDKVKDDSTWGRVIEVISSKPQSDNNVGAVVEILNYGNTYSNQSKPVVQVTADIIEGWPSWAGDKDVAPRVQSNGLDVMLKGDRSERLNASAGSDSQPVYFPSTGNDAGKPVAIPISTDQEIAAVGDFLTIQAQGAYYAHKAGTAASATTAGEANTANTANRANALNIGAMGSTSYYVVVFDAEGHPFKESDGSLGRLLFDASQKLLNTDIAGNATSATHATSADSATSAAKLNASAGSDSQPVYFPSTGNDAGKPVAIPLVPHSGTNYLQMQTEGAYYAQTAGTATSAVSATKDGLNRNIDTTYCTQQYADPLLRLVNARPITNQTYALQGTSAWTHAFAFNFANYGDMPRGRQSLILVCLQYECASGTALRIRMTYTGNELLVEALPDGRHYVTLPVIWTMEHSSLTEPFDMYFSGNGNIRAMSGTLILM